MTTRRHKKQIGGTSGDATNPTNATNATNPTNAARNAYEQVIARKLLTTLLTDPKVKELTDEFKKRLIADTSEAFKKASFNGIQSLQSFIADIPPFGFLMSISRFFQAINNLAITGTQSASGLMNLSIAITKHAQEALTKGTTPTITQGTTPTPSITQGTTITPITQGTTLPQPSLNPISNPLSTVVPQLKSFGRGGHHGGSFGQGRRLHTRKIKHRTQLAITLFKGG